MDHPHRLLTGIAVAFLCANAVCAQTRPPRPHMRDHTPEPLAAPVPHGLADLALPEGALGRLAQVYTGQAGVRSVQVAWLSGDRYL